ncbi:TnsA endonuclease N-terminal domain-containing protein [Pseudomonas avellanae]|uniref:TnsA endonuclease N-terminal domain-containing protein n=1 Tax=Pseudomonas avellanae TaxID=46257 RepID=UPI003D2FE290
MVKSRVTGRTHHYLSRQEFKVHLEAEYSRSTKNIREQYPLLPLAETQQIAADLGVRHPTYPTTRTPTVMTTDLLLTLDWQDGDQLLAISVKLTKDLTHRNLEKLLIERIYWNNRGVKWVLITEKGRRQKLSATPDQSGTVNLCHIMNSALKNASRSSLASSRA